MLFTLWMLQVLLVLFRRLMSPVYNKNKYFAVIVTSFITVYSNSTVVIPVKKRGKYRKYSANYQRTVGTYAAHYGIANAVEHYRKDFDGKGLPKGTGRFFYVFYLTG